VTFITWNRREDDFSPKTRLVCFVTSSSKRAAGRRISSSPVTNGFATSSARSTLFDPASRCWPAKLRGTYKRLRIDEERGRTRQEASYALHWLTLIIKFIGWNFKKEILAITKVSTRRDQSDVLWDKVCPLRKIEIHDSILKVNLL